jgi:hypothetical protein
MSLSRILPGRQNSIALSDGEPAGPVPERGTHAPMFARPGEPESNAVSGERMQPSQARPKRPATRTLAEASEIGLSMPEALGVRADSGA